MASRLFAPASSERVDNSGSLRGSEVREQDTKDNEPTKRRSSSLVGDLAASILGADVLAARKAPAPFPEAEDSSDGTRYYFAGGGRSAKISSHGTLSPALRRPSLHRRTTQAIPRRRAASCKATRRRRRKRRKRSEPSSQPRQPSLRRHTTRRRKPSRR